MQCVASESLFNSHSLTASAAHTSGSLQTALSKLPRKKSRAEPRFVRGAALIGSYRFPVLIWIEHPSADYYVCEQDSCGDESGYAHSMSPVPNPIYPLPIRSTFRHATSEWNQDQDRCQRNKKPDRIRSKQD